MAERGTDTLIKHHSDNAIPGCGFAATLTPPAVVLPGATAGRPQAVFPEWVAGPELSGWIFAPTARDHPRGCTMACRQSPTGAA